MDLEEQIASLKHTLDTISSPELVHLTIDLTFQSHTSLDLILTPLAALRDLDAIFARPNFSKLRQVELWCWNRAPKNPPISDTSQPSSASGSSSSPDPSSQVTHSGEAFVYKQTITENPKLAEEAIGHKIRYELKQLNARGILKIDFFLQREDTDNSL